MEPYSKDELRKQYRALRAALSKEALEEGSLSIANQMLKLPIWEFSYYHLFLSIQDQKEVDTSFLLTLLQGRDKEVVLPRVSGRDTLEHVLLTDNTILETNRWKIPEPRNGLQVPVTEIDVVFVPLLIFDRQGHRVGYGGGFYDRFLAQCKPETVKIGLSLFEPVARITDIHEADIPLDYGVCPEAIYAFSEP